MKGIVYLVGAGPGDAELLTIRAADLIRTADVILYDRLVGRGVLKLIPDTARRVYVGRAVGDETAHQNRTNSLLLRYAQEGLRVVRLKGGDPIIFGRGGEEARFLAEHGVKCEVIPGITSAIGSATYAGIPLTHRDHASSVVFVTGHEGEGKAGKTVNWKKLAGTVDTIVIMMGLSRLDHICAQLAAGGMPSSTPVMIIQDGTTKKQRVITGKLSDIARRAKASGIKPPANIIIGAVADPTISGWKI